MTQDKDQMRAEFEVAYWATFNTKGYEQSEIDDLRKDTFGRWPNDEYFYSSVKHAFLGWKLARASAPQGVPAMKTERMHEAMLGQYGVNSADPDGEIDRIFAAMLAAAPQTVAQNQGGIQ